MPSVRRLVLDEIKEMLQDLLPDLEDWASGRRSQIPYGDIAQYTDDIERMKELLK